MNDKSGLKGIRTAIQIPTLKFTVINQAAPVQNTWYVLCNLRNVAYIDHIFRILDTGETLEIEFSVDGLVFTGTQAALANANYGCNSLSFDAAGALYYTANAQGGSLSLNDSSRPSFFAKSLYVRIRKTTAVGVC